MFTILYVNMTTRHCAFKAPPAACAGLGGRSLGAALVAEINPLCEPLLAGNRLVFAPGLLGAALNPHGNRLNISCKSPLTGKLKSSNTSALAAEYLIALGILAVVVDGANGGILLQLTIRGSKAELVPALSSGKGNQDTAASMAAAYGPEQAFITIGQAGELGLLAANICCTNRPGATSHDTANHEIIGHDAAGYGAASYAGRAGMGAVMGTKGLKAITVFAPKTGFGGMQSAGFAEARMRFMAALCGHAGEPGEIATAGTPAKTVLEGCAPDCPVSCHTAGRAREQGIEGKYAGYQNLWGLAATEDFAGIATTFAALCGDAGIDAFAASKAIAVAMAAGVVPYGSGQGVLECVRQIAEGTPQGRIIGNGEAACRAAYGIADTQKNGIKTKETPPGERQKNATQSGRKGCEAVIADTAGLCIHAARAALMIPAAREALAEMIKLAYGWPMSAEQLFALGQATLDAEYEFNGRAGG